MSEPVRMKRWETVMPRCTGVDQALLVMINAPLALIRGIAVLFLTATYLSVPGSSSRCLMSQSPTVS